MEAQNSKRTQVITIAILVAIVLLVVGGMALTRGGDDRQSSSQQQGTGSSSQANTGGNTQSDTTASTATPNSATYKDGTYNASGSYRTPGGTESVDVQLTLKDGKVTDSTVTGSGSDRQAREYQSEFEQGYKQLVTGKPIESISLSRVSGSSLTSQGFNDALAKIADQART